MDFLYLCIRYAASRQKILKFHFIFSALNLQYLCIAYGKKVQTGQNKTIMENKLMNKLNAEQAHADPLLKPLSPLCLSPYKGGYRQRGEVSVAPKNCWVLWSEWEQCLASKSMILTHKKHHINGCLTP